MRWLNAAAQAKQVLTPAAMVTVVDDRGSGSCAKWASVPEAGCHMLTRAMQGRRLATGDMLFAAAAGFPVAGKRKVGLPARDPGKPKRTAVVAGFEHEADAGRLLAAMRAQFEEFALSLHPDKTRVLEFGRHAAARRRQRGPGKPETFTFLGFTFICGKTRKGKFLLHRKSRSDRMRAKLQEMQDELRQRRHQAIPVQGEWLRRAVSGFFNYHAVPTNSRALTVFHYHVRRLWLRTLQRRSEKDGSTWRRIEKLAADWLPKPRILHPWPRERFAVKYPR